MSVKRSDAVAVAEAIGPYAADQPSIAERGIAYEQLLGFVPPRIAARFAVTGAVDPKLLGLQEDMRTHAMNPGCFDAKTTQLLLFGMLMMELSDAAMVHGIAARRAGASWKEMQAVISLAFLFRGLPAANRGAELLAKLALAESGNAPEAKS